MESGQTPTVLALSHGSGDPKRDSVIAVFLDEEGRFRQLAKFDNLASSLTREGANPVHREAFAELIKARRPQVIVVGGFSASTKRLFEDVTAIATEVSDAIFDEELDGTLNESGEPLTGEERIARAKFEITYVFDDVARIYQNSQRAAAEFSELPTLGKYCVGLARYAQSPLNEYAALGSDLTAITHDVNQKFVRPLPLPLFLPRHGD
jgi:transcription elongation factor SPT6